MIKKMKALLAAILVPFSFATTNMMALAQGFSLRVGGGGTFSGNEILLTLQLSGSASVGGTCGGICGITTKLSYDAAKLELLSAAPSQGFDFTSGSTLVLYKATAANDGTILTLRFGNKALSDGESTTVTFSNIVGTNADAEFSAPNASLAVKYIAPKQQESEQPTHPSTPSQQPKSNNQQSASTTPDQSDSKDNSIKQEENGQDSKNGEEMKKNDEGSSTEDNEQERANECKDVNLPILIVAIIIAVLLAANLFVLLIAKKKRKSKRK